MIRQLILFIFVTCIASTKVHATPPAQFDYMLNCQGCHLADGSGFPTRNVPDLRSHLGKFLSVDGGREFIVQVPGSAQSDLNDRDLSRVLNWMLEAFSPKELPINFKPYSENEVARLRRQPLIHVTQRRQELIKKIEIHEATKP